MREGGLKKDSNAQMITLLGIIIAISVIVMSSLASEIANIDFVVTSREATSLTSEFAIIKDSFGISLNYNLADIIIGNSSNGKNEDETYLFGDMDLLNEAFNQTKDEFFNISLRYGLIFDAYLVDYWFSYEDTIQDVKSVFYEVEIKLSIDNGDSYIAEDVIYTILCIPE